MRSFLALHSPPRLPNNFGHIGLTRLTARHTWQNLSSSQWSGFGRWIVVAASLVAAQHALAQARTNPVDRGAADVEHTYEAIKPALRDSAFGKPLAIKSQQRDDQLQGDVYAVIDHSFSSVRDALRPASHWCEILMLHLNTKGCAVHTAKQETSEVSPSAETASLAVAVGSKHEEAPGESRDITLDYRVAAASPRLLDVRMQAKDGPMSTHDYRLWLQAVPVEGDRTFVHLHYAYGFGIAARLAMKGYLATIGRDKVGFSRSGPNQGEYVDGIRGVVERNAMRYYLAIDAYLDSLSAPPDRQREARFKAWFDATELYPRQLHEIDRDEYLTMKRHELGRVPRSP